MDITVFKRGSILVRAIVEPDDQSQQSISLMSEDILTLTFNVAEPIAFQIGDYCYFFSKQYVINATPEYTQSSERAFAYTLVLESQMYELGKSDFLFLNATNNFEDAVFPFRGNAQNYGDLLIYNLNRDFPQTGWKLGYVITTELVSQDFTATNCLDALKTIVGLFNTEYLIEGNVINIYQRQIASGITLKLGVDEALLSIQQANQTNANLITRLRVFGSTKNIVNTYRSASPRLRMSVATGDYLTKNLDVFGLFAKTIIFDGQTKDVKTGNPLPEIFPHRTGTISAVGDPIADPTTWFLMFFDAAIDFNVNDYLISGITAQVEFQTGFLAGYTFDINAFDNTTKKFTINQNTSDPNLLVPTDLLCPVIGDQYVVININQPQTYIDQAEADLKAAGLSYLLANCIPPLVFTNVIDPFYIQQRNITLLLAMLVGLESDVLGINRSLRIIQIQRKIQNTNFYSIQLADSANPPSVLVKLLNGI